MKKTYETPEMGIITLSDEDIILTSGGNAVLPDDEF